MGNREGTGANGGNGEGSRNLCSRSLLLLNSTRGGGADFTFLAGDTQTPFIGNRPLVVANGAELRD